VQNYYSCSAGLIGTTVAIHSVVMINRIRMRVYFRLVFDRPADSGGHSSLSSRNALNHSPGWTMPSTKNDGRAVGISIHG